MNHNHEIIMVPRTRPRFLVMSGGGNKGIALWSALNTLAQTRTDSTTFLSEVEGYAGTSIGSLITFHLASTGGDIASVSEWLLDPDFWDNPRPPLSEPIPHSLLLDRIDRVMASSGFGPTTTLLEHAGVTGKEWITNTCILWKGGMRCTHATLSARTHPYLLVRNVLAMSCCDPEHFAPIPLTRPGRFAVDGGECCNLLYPIAFPDREQETLVISVPRKPVVTTPAHIAERAASWMYLEVPTHDIPYSIRATRTQIDTLLAVGSRAVLTTPITVRTV